MEPLIGQIIIFGGNFAPRNWAFCDGSLLSISSNQALFSILGTTYGGDGRTTFGLPDLRGRVPAGVGQGPGLSPVALGQKFGEETVTLTVNQLPAHGHAINGVSSDGNSPDPSGNYLAKHTEGAHGYNNGASDVQMNSNSVSNTGNGESHDNRQPSLGLNYIIALIGTYPSRD